MKKILLVVLMLIILFTLQAKKKKDTKPDWLENPKDVYPENIYLTAIGDGDSRSEAENYAAGNLSKIFESKIKADQTVRERYQELITEEGSTFEESSDITKQVNIQSEQTLINIQFAESYTDNMGRVFVIAYLDRMKTADIYFEKIMKNAAKIEFFITQGNETETSISKYANLNAAAAISLNNEIMLDQLSIISPNSKASLELGYNYNDLNKEAAESAKLISFSVDIGNDVENKVTILVEELMTDLDFVLSDDANLHAVGSVAFEETDIKRENLVFVRYDLQLKINDNSGTTFITISDKGREGHVSFPEATARAIRTVEKKIKKELKKKLVSYFDGLVIKKN